MSRWHRAALGLAVLLAGCANSSDEPDRALRVFAAASLTEAFFEAADAFEQEMGATVEVSFAGSQTLLQQLAEGAEADVLATADEQSMSAAVEQELVGEPVIFATNTLVLVVPSANPADIDAPQDIARRGTKLVLAAEEVPAGRYAREALSQLDLESALDNLVSEEEDVKGVVGKVASGEADAGIVYATDVTDELKDQLTPIPLAGVQVDIRYPVATTPAAPPLAADFVEFLVDVEGAQILQSAGFGAP